MNRCIPLVVCALVGGGCSNPVADAKARLAIVEKDGSLDDICQQSREVERAYLQAQDQEGYSEAKTAASIECLAAAQGIDNRHPQLQADNLDAAISR